MAIQTYELVDKHIRRLDSDLARFESEIQDKALNSRVQDEPAVGKSELNLSISLLSLKKSISLFSLKTSFKISKIIRIILCNDL